MTTKNCIVASRFYYVSHVRFSKFDNCFIYPQLNFVNSLLLYNCKVIQYPFPLQLGIRVRQVRSCVFPSSFCHRNYLYFFWTTQRAPGTTLQGMKRSCVGSPHEWRWEEFEKLITVLLCFVEKYGFLFLLPFSLFLLNFVCA